MNPAIILVALLLIAVGIYVSIRRKRGRTDATAGTKPSADASALPQMTLPPTPNGDAVDKARDAIVNALWTVLAALETRRQEDASGNGPWAELSAHVLKYVSAIKTMPRSIPVIVIATVNATAVLGEQDAASEAATAALQDMAAYLARATVRELALLTEIQGRKVSTEETRHAQTFIDSLEWNSAQRAFVSSGAA